MYSPEVTIIAIPPQDFWGATFILGLLLATGLIYLAVSQPGKPYRAPAWETLSPLALAIMIPLAILWFALFLLAVWAAFWATYQLLQPHAATSIPQTSGLGALGLGTLLAGLLGAPFVIWGTVLKHRTVGFQKEGHLTDRISKAVEQLGAEKTVKRDGSEETVPNIEVRIGGILSLERIAQDSTAYDHGRDHVRCMEILCAYIRENAPASGAMDHSFGEWEPLKDDATAEERAAHLEKRKARFGSNSLESQVYKWTRKLPEPRADIALALRVLGRRTAAQRQAEARWGKYASPNVELVFDLPCPSLPDAADDRATTADELTSYQAKLREWKTKIDAYAGYRLDLRKTNLQRADLSDLILSGAKLQEARMEGANLFRVRMEGASLWRARLEGAGLWQARLQGADLWQALMEGANFMQAGMEGADLGLARLEGASLSRARVEGADLRQARMEGANLYEASFVGASLRHMDYSGVGFSRYQITSTFGDASVILPNGVTPQSPDWPAHWPKFKLNEFDTEWRKWQASPATYTPPDPPK